MKKTIISLFLALLMMNLAMAQSKESSRKKLVTYGKSNAASFNAYVPLGVFQRSHWIGAGLEYAWSHKRFGANVTAPGLIGFTVVTGGDYYLGEKQKTAGYDFKFDNYLYLHFLAGIIMNPWSNVNMSLTAGPAIGIYKGNTDAGYGVNLSGSYYWKKKISIGPALICRKYSDADALWAIGLKAACAF